MGNTLFTNVRIFDGTGEHPYLGEVLVQATASSMSAAAAAPCRPMAIRSSTAPGRR